MNKNFFSNTIKKIFTLFFLCIFCFSIFASCQRTYFYEVKGIWACNILTIQSYGEDSDEEYQYPEGILVVEDNEYRCHIPFQKTSAHFYDEEKIEIVGRSLESLLWECTIELRRDKLYVEVRRDGGFERGEYGVDHTGNTYILEKIG